MAQSDFCNEFLNRDLRYPDQCKDAVEGCDWVFNLAVRAPRPSPPAPPLTRRPRCPASHAHRAGPRHRLTWAAWALSNPTTRASCTTRR